MAAHGHGCSTFVAHFGYIILKHLVRGILGENGLENVGQKLDAGVSCSVQSEGFLER